MLSTFRTSTPALYSEKCHLILYTTFSKIYNLYVLNKSRIVNSLKDSQVIRYVFKQNSVWKTTCDDVTQVGTHLEFYRGIAMLHIAIPIIIKQAHI